MPEELTALSEELRDWLAHMQGGDSLVSFETLDQLRFPTEEMLVEYLAVVGERPDDEFRGLLRQFLFPAITFESDQRNLRTQLQVRGRPPEPPYPMEYWDSLVRSLAGRHPAQPGLRWVLDLLPEWPEAALRVIESYLLVFGQHLPDGRLEGVADASALIRARYLESGFDEGGAARSALANLRPRELEVLVAAAYRALGHATVLTAPTRDGGRDIEASITRDGMVQRVLIECKHWSGTVGVEPVRALAGVVHDNRATSGVLVTTSTFSPVARAFSDRTAQMHLVDGDGLLELLGRSIGPTWFRRIDRILARG